MTSLHVNLSIPYKNENITLIAKVIKRVRKILNDYLIIKTTLIFIFLQFKKRNPNAPVGEGSWIIKYLIKKRLQNRRDYQNKKTKGKGKKKENNECKIFNI